MALTLTPLTATTAGLTPKATLLPSTTLLPSGGLVLSVPTATTKTLTPL